MDPSWDTRKPLPSWRSCWGHFWMQDWGTGGHFFGKKKHGLCKLDCGCENVMGIFSTKRIHPNKWNVSLKHERVSRLGNSPHQKTVKFGYTFGRIWQPQEFEGNPVIVRPKSYRSISWSYGPMPGHVGSRSETYRKKITPTEKETCSKSATKTEFLNLFYSPKASWKQESSNSSGRISINFALF